MRLLFIRHGDPDYVNDSLTEKGRREAALLAEHIESLNPGEIFVSPLGRARATAAYSLEKLNRAEVILPWLEEFTARVDPNRSEEVQRAYRNELRREADGSYHIRLIWDMLPAYWTEHPEYYHPTEWRNSEIVRCGNMAGEYDRVIASFDAFLAERGYVRERNHYRVERSNSDTITFFCHFGITAVLLSRLWNCSPFVTLQQIATAPTSVTEAVTEEREQGIAAFRLLRLGDTTHLTLGGEKPSFSARFCERFENEDERH